MEAMQVDEPSDMQRLQEEWNELNRKLNPIRDAQVKFVVAEEELKNAKTKLEKAEVGSSFEMIQLAATGVQQAAIALDKAEQKTQQAKEEIQQAEGKSVLELENELASVSKQLQMRRAHKIARCASQRPQFNLQVPPQLMYTLHAFTVASITENPSIALESTSNQIFILPKLQAHFGEFYNILNNGVGTVRILYRGFAGGGKTTSMLALYQYGLNSGCLGLYIDGRPLKTKLIGQAMKILSRLVSHNNEIMLKSIGIKNSRLEEGYLSLYDVARIGSTDERKSVEYLKFVISWFENDKEFMKVICVDQLNLISKDEFSMLYNWPSFSPEKSLTMFAETSSTVSVVRASENSAGIIETPIPFDVNIISQLLSQISFTKLTAQKIFDITNGIPRDIAFLLNNFKSTDVSEYELINFKDIRANDYRDRFDQIVKAMDENAKIEFLQEVVLFFTQQPVRELPSSWQTCGLAIKESFEPIIYKLLSPLVRRGLVLYVRQHGIAQQILRVFSQFTQVSWLALELAIQLEFDARSMKSITTQKFSKPGETMDFDIPPGTRHSVHIEPTSAGCLIPNDRKDNEPVLLIMHPNHPVFDFVLLLYNDDESIKDMIYIQVSKESYVKHNSKYIKLTNDLRNKLKAYSGISNPVNEHYIHVTTNTSGWTNPSIKKHDPEHKVLIVNPNDGILRKMIPMTFGIFIKEQSSTDSMEL